MPISSRKKIALLLLAAIVLLAGGWLYANRVQRIALSTYVPESALGYLEINDWPRVVDRVTATPAWNELAPLYGIPDSVKYLGKAGWLGSLGVGGEAAMLARSQFAVVVTGLEVRGEEVKPHLALLVETHSSADRLKSLAEARLPVFAKDTFGKVEEEKTEHSGIAVRAWRGSDKNRGLYAAQIESELILANHLDALRACIDTRLGRAASMENNFYLQNARPLVERDGSAFGFVSASGVTRLLRFGAFLMSGGAVGKAALAGAVGEVFTEFSSRTTDGIAYGASFENGQMVDRYALLFKPDLVDTLKKTLKPVEAAPAVFDVIPADARKVTLINIENPVKAFDGIEAAISGRVSAMQGFLLHQFILSARETFFGLQRGSKAEEAIGNEIANFDLFLEADGPEGAGEYDRVWLVSARDRALLMAIIEKVMVAGGAVLTREKVQGNEILSSSDGGRGSAAFIGNYLALGRRERLLQTIEMISKKKDLKSAPKIAEALKAGAASAMMRSYELDPLPTREMMQAIARWAGAGKTPDKQAVERHQPLSLSETSVNDRGLFIESRSPFGNLPSLISLAAGVSDEK